METTISVPVINMRMNEAKAAYILRLKLLRVTDGLKKAEGKVVEINR